MERFLFFSTGPKCTSEPKPTVQATLREGLTEAEVKIRKLCTQLLPNPLAGVCLGLHAGTSVEKPPDDSDHLKGGAAKDK